MTPHFDPWFILSIFAICFTSLQMVPQVIKSLRTRKLEDVSIGLAIIVSLSAITWLIYGLHLHDAAIVIANAINLAGAAILLFLKFKEGISG
jgi:MtN3 and saliva related transmembrane protein